MHYETRDPTWGSVTRPDYGRHSYIRAELSDGALVDGNAIGWTTGQVYAQWRTPGGKVHLQWMDAEHVTRIKRSESSWTNPYDDYKWFREQGEL